MRIALATEGKSEHWIIKHIVETYFKGTEILFRQIQPQIVNYTQETPGGWLEILKFCEKTDDIKSALIEADYLVIQIDTDASQNINYGVSHTKQGNIAKTKDELYIGVVGKLNSLINANILEEYGEKIVFAICIHTIECWLLPIYYTNNHKSGTQNCLTVLNTELRKQNLDILPPKGQKNKRKLAYESILRNLRAKKDIVKSATHNVGYKKFVDSLEALEIID